MESAFAGLPGESGFSVFRWGKLGNSKEGNLHSFKHANDAHEDKKNDNSNGQWNTFPHGGIAIAQREQPWSLQCKSPGWQQSTRGSATRRRFPAAECMDPQRTQLACLQALIQSYAQCIKHATGWRIWWPWWPKPWREQSSCWYSQACSVKHWLES